MTNLIGAESLQKLEYTKCYLLDLNKKQSYRETETAKVQGTSLNAKEEIM